MIDRPSARGKQGKREVKGKQGKTDRNHCTFSLWQMENVRRVIN